MKKIYSFTALFMCLTNVYAEEFSIEATNLKTLPKLVEAVVRAPKNFAFPECKLIGKTIKLNDSNKAFNYIVTTSEACGWGASTGPVWIVAKLNAGYVVVLETATYAVQVDKKISQGLHQIVTTSGTAGHASYTRWSFNGKIYKQLENYVFFPDDKKLCKAHRDICPFEVGQ